MRKLFQAAVPILIVVAVAIAGVSMFRIGQGSVLLGPANQSDTVPLFFGSSSTWVGDTGITLTAVPTDASGNVLKGLGLDWSSSDTSVASVSGGRVTARKAGTARIMARVGGLSGAATVVVHNPPTSIDSSAAPGCELPVARARSAEKDSLIVRLSKSQKDSHSFGDWLWMLSQPVTILGLVALILNERRESKRRNKESKDGKEGDGDPPAPEQPSSD